MNTEAKVTAGALMKLGALTTVEKKIDFIGSRKMLRVARWRGDSYGGWRAGIEWYSEERNEFMCERRTLDECLSVIIDWMTQTKREFKKKHPPITLLRLTDPDQN